MTDLTARPRPLDIIGYRKDGRPIRLIGGGDGTGGPDPAPPTDPAPAVPPAPAPVPPVPPAPPAPPTPFDPNTLTPEARAWLESERKRVAAEEGAKARTQSKENAAAEARKELLAKLGLEPDVKPEDAAAQLATERAERKAIQVNYSVRDAARDAGGDHELVSAYLQAKGRLKDLDPSASDFDEKIKALVDQAVAEKPSLKLASAPAVVPPGGSGPGSSVVPGSTPPPRTRSADYVSALQAHYKRPTQ